MANAASLVWPAVTVPTQQKSRVDLVLAESLSCPQLRARSGPVKPNNRETLIMREREGEGREKDRPMEREIDRQRGGDNAAAGKEMVEKIRSSIITMASLGNLGESSSSNVIPQFVAVEGAADLVLAQDLVDAVEEVANPDLNPAQEMGANALPEFGPHNIRNVRGGHLPSLSPHALKLWLMKPEQRRLQL
ncbi:unnamed protein product [Brassica oleracea var. botrytis]|uniref:BnaC07g12530D protein n=4 Tax=Brassica TaxID=3705 RepID=A0A078GPC6_BRANA|nr:hypothetical protein HID58_075518 [Brassica napus]CAF1976234.1 unnamed protein product [Brassica napus]CDY28425.1 BnaC07g12530D [Brassica napus]VDD36927.1 unnamed protein product [Brassica oleracea]